MMNEKAVASMMFPCFAEMAKEYIKTGKTPDQTIAEMAVMPLAGIYEYLAVLKPLYAQELRELATLVDQVDIEAAKRNPAPDR